MSRRRKQPTELAPVSRGDAQKRVYGITIQQYKVGLDMYRANASAAQIKTATRMSHAQVVWCATRGSEEDAMPSWDAILREEVTKIRLEAIDVAKRVGEGTAEILREQLEVKKKATSLIKSLMAIYTQYGVFTAINEAREKGIPVDLDDLAMSPSTRETLKTLSKIANVSEVANTFSSIYKPILEMNVAKGLSKTAQEELSADSLMPASVSIVEPMRDRGDSTVDPVDTLLGKEFENWSDEDLENFLNGRGLPEPVIDVEGVEVVFSDDLDDEDEESLD